MVIRPIYRQNFRSKLHRLIFAQYRKNGRKSDKKPVTRPQKPSGPNSLRIILVLWSLTYGQNINSKAIGQLGTYLRKLHATDFLF
jgi:hypothetical protein